MPQWRFVPWLRNILIIFGAYWLSLWVSLPLSWFFGQINNRIIYSGNLLEGLAMGIMLSLGRALAAALAGVLVTVLISSRKAYLCALVIAALYTVDYRARGHWVVPPTAWDQLWMQVERFFPAVLCIVAAFVTAWLRTKRESATVRRDS
ncbi:MAG: hypothetical protein WBE86_01875 [Candidatus Acidiferrales bacterium]